MAPGVVNFQAEPWSPSACGVFGATKIATLLKQLVPPFPLQSDQRSILICDPQLCISKRAQSLLQSAMATNDAGSGAVQKYLIGDWVYYFRSGTTFSHDDVILCADP